MDTHGLESIGIEVFACWDYTKEYAHPEISMGWDHVDKTSLI